MTTLRFLGNSACFPEVGGDSPCMLVNDDLLIDTGWFPLIQLERCGADPGKIKLLLFTHLHHDHYMGLPQFFFWHAMKNPWPLSELTVAGPREDVERMVKKAADYLEPERYFPEFVLPTVKPLAPGDILETEKYRVETVSSRHPVAGLCYRITDKETGKILCLTGDTSYFEGQTEFFRGGDVIVSETAMALSRTEGLSYGHSSVYDAVKVADGAGVPRMFCIHLVEKRLREVTQAAQEMRKSPYTVEYPELFRTYTL